MVLFTFYDYKIIVWFILCKLNDKWTLYVILTNIDLTLLVRYEILDLNYFVKKDVMNKTRIRKLKSSDKDKVFSILSQNDWAYHAGTKITRARFEKQFDGDYYNRKGVVTFIIEKAETVIGLVRIFDLGADEKSDETPLFDIRIEEQNRQKGIGTEVVNQMIDYIFKTYPNKIRIEATTRIDNKGMRNVLEKCHFAKEAHYRNAWNGQEGKKYAAIGYGILRSDWENGEATKVDWTT